MFSTLFKKMFKSTSNQILTISKKQKRNSLEYLLAELGILFFKSPSKKEATTSLSSKRRSKPLSQDLQQIAANQLVYSKLIAAKMKRTTATKVKRKVVFVME